MEEEDRAEEAKRDEQQAASHGIGAVDAAPLLGDQRQDQLEDRDDQGEENEVVHGLAQPAKEEPPGGVKERGGHENRAQRHKQGERDLGDQNHTEADSGGERADDVDDSAKDPRAEVDRTGFLGDLLGEIGCPVEELVEGRPDVGHASSADGLGQRVGQDME